MRSAKGLIGAGSRASPQNDPSPSVDVDEGGVKDPSTAPSSAAAENHAEEKITRDFFSGRRMVWRK
jgi:hypothetical protein